MKSGGFEFLNIPHTNSMLSTQILCIFLTHKKDMAPSHRSCLYFTQFWVNSTQICVNFSRKKERIGNFLRIIGPSVEAF
jgi:hypothetical protein